MPTKHIDPFDFVATMAAAIAAADKDKADGIKEAAKFLASFYKTLVDEGLKEEHAIFLTAEMIKASK